MEKQQPSPQQTLTPSARTRPAHRSPRRGPRRLADGQRFLLSERLPSPPQRSHPLCSCCFFIDGNVVAMQRAGRVQRTDAACMVESSVHGHGAVPLVSFGSCGQGPAAGSGVRAPRGTGRHVPRPDALRAAGAWLGLFSTTVSGPGALGAPGGAEAGPEGPSGHCFGQLVGQRPPVHPWGLCVAAGSRDASEVPLRAGGS